MTTKEAIEQLICDKFLLLCASEHPAELDFTEFAIAKAALEKQIPKKPRETRCALMCSCCGHKITEKGCKKLDRKYCKVCGQAIDWE